LKGIRWVPRAVLARVVALAGCGANGSGPNDAALGQPSPNSGGADGNARADWVQRGTPRSWRWVASSADGTKLVAVEYPGYIYTSSGPGP
jgi:hypothetical protein